MLQLVKKLLHRLGVDKAIFYTSSGRIIQGAGAVVTVLFIVRYLTGIEQGFYYTFASILAIQVFFELGLNGIITQYVAHENAHIQWDERQMPDGDPRNISREAYLLRFCIKWYSILAVALLVILLGVGLVYFKTFYRIDTHVSWVWPWMLLCVGTTLNFLIGPVAAFLEGLGKVRQIAQYRFYAQFAVVLIVWSGLYFGARLYVGGISSIVSALIFVTWILGSRHRKTLASLLKVHVVEKVHYRLEIFPYQWKIALSWMSGYFIFQLFNPVLFAFSGPVVAGQMGMTLAVLNGVSALSMSWISTKVPMFSNLIAKGEYPALDGVFNKTLRQQIFICTVCVAVFILGVYVLELSHRPERERLLAWLPLGLMAGSMVLNQLVYSWATYLRCHKQEPFLAYSVVGGVLCALSTFFLGKYVGVTGITASYFLITACLLPWAYYIFKTKKQQWHRMIPS